MGSLERFIISEAHSSIAWFPRLNLISQVSMFFYRDLLKLDIQASH